MTHDSIRELRQGAAQRGALQRALARLDPRTRLAALEILSLYAEVSAARRGTSIHPLPALVARGSMPARAPRPIPLARRVARRLKLVGPADNVLLCVAQLMARTGAASFTVEEVREQAAGAGLGMPARPGNTIRSARREGKPLFRRARGRWRLTSAGARHFRTAYGLRSNDPPQPLRAHG